MYPRASVSAGRISVNDINKDVSLRYRYGRTVATNRCDGTLGPATAVAAAAQTAGGAGAGDGGCGCGCGCGCACGTPPRNCACTWAKRARPRCPRAPRPACRPPPSSCPAVYRNHRCPIPAGDDDHRKRTPPTGACTRGRPPVAVTTGRPRPRSGRPTTRRAYSCRSWTGNSRRSRRTRTPPNVACNR